MVSNFHVHTLEKHQTKSHCVKQEKEFLNSKTSIMISSPVITTKIANMLMELVLKGIHIKNNL